MRGVGVTSALLLGILLLALLPVVSAATPVSGTVTTCTTTMSCQFVFNTTAGTGWASTIGSRLSFQLPGEAKASYNLSYAAYIARLTGTYTYWTVGNFVGTDVNTGKVVYGTTNTNFTITCHGHSGRGGGCTYTYTTDNGTIVFHLTNSELTSTSVACSPTSIDVASKTTCKVTVSNVANGSNTPVGKVHVTAGVQGTMSGHGVCTLSGGTCSLTFQPSDNACNAAPIAATFGGTPGYYKSAGTTTVTITGGC
ncbi:MAG TPA: hypothetical protein VJQ43_00900 [Thermoplasmata archaeon]|nr:hypothetical protein [Thermoplasmata archaeon]